MTLKLKSCTQIFSISLFCVPFLLFFGCENPVIEEQGAVIQGTVSIEGMEDVSNVLISAEKVTDGQTRRVREKIGSFDTSEKPTKGIYTAVTDEEGTFKIADLEEGSYTVTAQKNDALAASETGIIVTTKDVTQVDITLTATGNIAGTVTLDGQPTGNGGTFVVVDGTSYMAVTSDSGDYTISKIPVGTGYSVTFYHDGFSQVSISSIEVTAAGTTDPGSGSPTNLISETGTITGTVTLDGQTAGLSGTTVSVEGTGIATVTTDLGDFTLPEVPNGMYEVTLTHPGYLSATEPNVTVTAGATTDIPTVDLVKGPEIQVQFLDITPVYLATPGYMHIPDGFTLYLDPFATNFPVPFYIKNTGGSVLTLYDGDGDTNYIEVEHHADNPGTAAEPWQISTPPATTTINPGESEAFTLTWQSPGGEPEDEGMYYATITIECDDAFNRFFSFVVFGEWTF